jgi:hypothetical protein
MPKKVYRRMDGQTDDNTKSIVHIFQKYATEVHMEFSIYWKIWIIL